MWICLDDIPQIFKVPCTVTYGMGILAHNIRPRLVGRFRIVPDTVHMGVHRSNNIRIAVFARLLKLHRAKWVSFFQPIVSLVEHRAITALIAQTPYNDARMVLAPLKHALDTVKEIGRASCRERVQIWVDAGSGHMK